MEDILPLLIVIAISIIGAAGRKKKRVGGTKSIPRPMPQRDDDILSWLEKMSGETLVPPPAENPNQELSHVEVEPVPFFEEKYAEKEEIPNKYAQFGGFISPDEREAMMKKEGESVVEHKPGNGTSSPQIPDVETDEEEPGFDLRQAVIYSEILNRKYA